MGESDFFHSTRGRRASKCIPLDLQTFALQKRKSSPDSDVATGRQHDGITKAKSLSWVEDTKRNEETAPSGYDLYQRSEAGNDVILPQADNRRLLPRRAISLDFDDGVKTPSRSRKQSEIDDLTEDGGEKMRLFKIKVVRKLLAGFNLDKTLAHYRSQNANSFTINPMEFSSDCVMDANAYSERLHDLTGGYEVRQSDHQHMRRLRDKIWADYQAEEDKAEKERMELERQRLRKLVERGILGPDDLRYADPALYREYRPSEPWNQPRRREPTKRKNRHKGAKTNENRCKSASQAEEKVTAVTPRERTPGHWPSYAPARGDQKPRPTSTRSALTVTFRNDDTPTPACRGSHRDTREVGWHDENRTSSRQEVTSRATSGYSSRSGRSSPLFIRRYQHPVVIQMRQEETVEGLYSLAGEIILSRERREKIRVAEETKKQEKAEEKEYPKVNPRRGTMKLR